jgi:hypothetical protein
MTEPVTAEQLANGATPAPAAEAAPPRQQQPAGEDLAAKVLRDSTLTLRVAEEIDTRLTAMQIELAVCIGLLLLLAALAGAQLKASAR